MEKGKIRMTAQSLVNIKAAKSASLTKVNGGYKVVLKGETGRTAEVQTGDNSPAVYPSMVAAKKAVHRHNRMLFQVALTPEI